MSQSDLRPPSSSKSKPPPPGAVPDPHHPTLAQRSTLIRRFSHLRGSVHHGAPATRTIADDCDQARYVKLYWPRSAEGGADGGRTYVRACARRIQGRRRSCMRPPTSRCCRRSRRSSRRSWPSASTDTRSCSSARARLGSGSSAWTSRRGRRVCRKSRCVVGRPSPLGVRLDELQLCGLCQALAAIGQGRLIALWDNLFGQLEQPIAQVLLTRGDISDVSSLSERMRGPSLDI